MQAGATPPLPLYASVVVQRTVRVDNAHSVRVAGVSRDPRGTRPHPVIVLGNHIAVLAILVTGQQENLLIDYAIQLIAVIGYQIDRVIDQIVAAQTGQQVFAQLVPQGTLAPVVAALKALVAECLMLVKLLRRNSEDSALNIRVKNYPLQPLEIEPISGMKILNAFVCHGKTSK